MSTAATQQIQYTHYQQQQQQQQHKQQQNQKYQNVQKMEHSNKALTTQPSSSAATTSSMLNNAQCRPCLNRFLEFRNQAINRMTTEYQKIWTGQGVPAVSFLHRFVTSFIWFCN